MKKIFIQDVDISLEIYQEEYPDEGAYEIEQKLSKEEFERFKAYVVQQRSKESEYFSCKIDGVSKDKIRFGVISHKEVDEDVLVRGPLVEKSYDENIEKSRYDDNFKLNFNRNVFKLKIINERLLEMLLQKDLISSRELDDLKYVTEEEIQEEYFDHNTF